MSSLNPRVVLVSRETEYAALLANHGTRGQAEFFLSTRGQKIEGLEVRDALQSRALTAARNAIPEDWSFVQVMREDLSRFLFSDNDIIVPVGQDGLVANLAKYLDGQLVVGVTPDPVSSEGVLARHSVDALPALLRGAAHADVDIQARSMVEANTGEGLSLLALNELFFGHRSHQSARYVVQAGGSEEFQSSSGLIVATGTGLTGWAKSIMTATHRSFEISPEDSRAAFFAREPWPSRTSGCDIAAGEIARDANLTVLSRINEGGVIFADGIEQDFLPFDWGVEAQVHVSDKRLSLVV
ncbi:inorganic polyphosphate kinase [Leisingera sp. ANG-M7]|uniref:inorganic polyphosphate kinase n=1 Tax=Leisingera sp. ANG-M7 TaxID=1577902 RepID=UPI00057F9ED0|nr:inorganic polyphosphate kinase [Leisingera sp. ANG-M7]KIC38244.1 inorganic polyphosphate kinase [Leisingera sp. ANG-M7]